MQLQRFQWWLSGMIGHPPQHDDDDDKLQFLRFICIFHTLLFFKIILEYIIQ